MENIHTLHMVPIRQLSGVGGSCMTQGQAVRLTPLQYMTAEKKVTPTWGLLPILHECQLLGFLTQSYRTTKQFTVPKLCCDALYIYDRDNKLQYRI